MADFDFSISSEDFGSAEEIRARRERTAFETMHTVGYEEASQILATAAVPGDPWAEAFSKALKSASDGAFLTGRFEADVRFLVAAKLHQGAWFSPMGEGSAHCAKGLIPEDRVATLLGLARRKGLI